jgi:hypothetical protein
MGGMGRCYTFNEWFGICGRLEGMYWACWRACVEYAEKIKEVDRGSMRGWYMGAVRTSVRRGL